MAGFDKPLLQTSKNNQISSTITRNRTIFYGDVVSVDDDTDGARIKVRVPELDNSTADNELPWSYPMMPRYFHNMPQVGELVRILIEDTAFPERSRFWMGSIISQPHKIGFDSKFSALSTTNLALTKPEKSPSKYPDANGVYPSNEDIGIIGKINTDVLLKSNEVHIRAGKHENDNPLKLNTDNPASINMVFEPNTESGEYYSNTIIQSDKLALITHSGNPRFKAARVTQEDRDRVFDDGHPIARGDVLVEALRVIVDALITHLHPYSNMPADKTAIMKKLEELQLDLILQENIVIN